MSVSTLDCQDCGKVLRELSPAEAQKVADRPYDHVWYCVACKNARNRERYLEMEY
jgi:uncharacterized protein with PIN domain